MTRKNQKGITVVLILLLGIALLGVIGYMLFQNMGGKMPGSGSAPVVTDSTQYDTDSMPTLSPSDDDKTLQSELDATDLGESALDKDLMDLDKEASTL